ncbi:unnamed protein product [Musa acuminata subsp. malaccensis]|nr:unnamed protein product [Musa acuminata subsp. malaccensis]
MQLLGTRQIMHFLDSSLIFFIFYSFPSVILLNPWLKYNIRQRLIRDNSYLIYSIFFLLMCKISNISIGLGSIGELGDHDWLLNVGLKVEIWLVTILPNRIIKPLAEHSEYPIELIAFSNDRKFLGSISHDQMFKVRSSHSI